MKALITAQGQRPPKTHDIDILLSHLEGLKIEWDEELSALTAYSVEARYPGPPIPQEEASRALEIAKKTLKQAIKILKKMGIEC